jgi:integrase
MAIFKYIKDGTALYRVRAQWKSARDPSVRITKQVSGIRTEAEATRLESRLSKEVRDQAIQEETKRSLAGKTWGGVLQHWYQAQLSIRVPFGAISRTTLDDAYGGLKKCMASFEHLPCSDITPLDLMKMFNELSDRGVSPGHRQKLRTKIKAVFDHGIQAGLILIPRNPVHDLVFKKAEERKPEILSIGEIRRLIELAFARQHDWRYVWAIALLTGMRNGELYALRWSDIDWDQKLITAARSYNGRTKMITATKAGYWRDVPLSQDAVKLLQEVRAVTGSEEYVLPRLDRWANGIQAAVLRAFCVEHGLPSVRFHTLRACFGTQLLRQGVSAVVVMKIAGWRDLKTMQRYIRLAGVEVAGATDKLSFLPPEEVAANVVAFRSRA